MDAEVVVAGMQGVAFAGPALCMIACSVLTPHGTAHLPGAMPTAAIVTLFSLSFAMGAWARAGLYCNHQVSTSSSFVAFPTPATIMMEKCMPWQEQLKACMWSHCSMLCLQSHD